ncbi:MAG: hypothetical protein COA70_06255 [Planctomycetota bacterium]|nr:MAG: hypothetical protein COA70_06255 [Planctomycetota bacterium]
MIFSHFLTLLFAATLSPQQGEAAKPLEGPLPPAIQNPYFEVGEWRVWRDDASPILDLASVEKVEKEEQAISITLQPIALKDRVFPNALKLNQKGVIGEILYSKDGDSKAFAGMWDDVYSSWSGLHGYVRPNWRGVDGSLVKVKEQIMHFVDRGHKSMMLAGVNFVHQSTTGMAHTITNGYSLEMTTSYERLYFADCLVTSPAHSSFTDLLPESSSDLYIAHVPTLFNSVGSSNSETMAITKMMMVGGFLPPGTKLLLKRNGLYPSALLYIWKASLPYEVPYDHELRHRVAYKAVGNRNTYPEKYSAAGIEKGDLSLAFHQYDDLQHVHNMVQMASSMHTAPPEAIFQVESLGDGTLHYALKKSAVILQEEGEDVELLVSVAASYDLQNLPLQMRWKLLYGQKETTIEQDPENPLQYRIKVPWSDALPEGRTALALFANNGIFDGNPAILTVYRKKSDLPPNGGGYADYKFPLTFSNQRPALIGLMDQWVKPGKEIRIPLRGIDPEGSMVKFYKRAGEVGEIIGDEFVWQCPKKEKKGVRTVTFVASDGTSGNSYAGKQIQIHVGKPDRMAVISAKAFVGVAPWKVKFSAKESVGRKSKTKFTWEILKVGEKPAKGKEAKRAKGREYSYTFKDAGRYSVQVWMDGNAEESQVVEVLVLEKKKSKHSGDLWVIGNGVRISAKPHAPQRFEGTDFSNVQLGQSKVMEFSLWNSASSVLRFDPKKSIQINGEHADDFQMVVSPKSALEGGGLGAFSIRFTPSYEGQSTAILVVGPPSKRVEFSVCGTGRKPSAK